MNKLFKSVLLSGITASFLMGVTPLTAQPAPGGQGGNRPDPAQMRQMMMERMRERFDVKDDAEWKILETRIEKVTTARQQAGGGFGGGMRGMMRPPGGGQGGPNATAGQPGQQGGRRGGFGPEPSAEEADLQKALDGKASNDELKTKLAALRESRKAKQAALVAAQEELRKVLSVKQEAEAYLMGLVQ
jgi:hypothetical protein